MMNEFEDALKEIYQDVIQKGEKHIVTVSEQPHESLAKQLFRTLVLGSLVKFISSQQLMPPTYNYLILTDKNLYRVSFRREKKVDVKAFSRDILNFKSMEEKKNGILMNIKLEYKNDIHSFDIWAFQFTWPNGGVETGQDIMKKIGTMTTKFAQEIEKK